MADESKAAPLALILLVALLSLAAGTLFLYFSLRTDWTSDLLIQTLLLTLIAWAAETQAVQFSKRLHISSATLPVLLGIFFLGPAPAAIIASVSILAGYKDSDFIDLVFNFLANALPVMLVAFIFTQLSDPFSFSSPIEIVSIGFIFAGFITGLTWEASDFALISLRVSLRHKVNYGRLWKNNFVPALPSQIIILCIGLLMAAIYIKAGIAAVVLMFVPILASQHVYKLLVQQKDLLADQTKLSQD